jgi:four helix bundle protein
MNNVIQEKSYAFAIRIVRICQHLANIKKEFVLSKQLLKSGTSIGANLEESIGGQSKRDFCSKIDIAYKEARETHYWLRLLRDTDQLDPEEAESLLANCNELLRIMGAIRRTTKNNIQLSMKEK